MAAPPDGARPVADGEAGFTLVEVLVTVVILGVIMSAVAMSMVVVLRNQSAQADRAAGSYAAERLTLWFPTDAASAPTTGVDLAAATPTGCLASPAATATNFNLVRFAWSDAASGVGYRAAYRVVQGADGWTVWRYACTTGGTAETRAVIRNLRDGTPSSISASRNSSTTTIQATTQTGSDVYTFSLSGTSRAPGAAVVA